ncbi:hypothetical protein BC629DRAFT_422662 [Irpex lacteus]|nr:hypothetical protein BC629DRAFT_422662 [Irpex lacteus]
MLLTKTIPASSVRDSNMFYFSHSLISIFLADCLQFILEMYGVSGETCRRTATPNVMSKIFAISRELWYPTVQEIRNHAIPLDNDQMAKMRDWALQVWLTFGKKLGFNERVEERRVRAMSTSQDHSQGLRDAARRGSVDATNELRRAQGVDNGWRGILSPFVVNSRMCHWKDCLCSWDEKPPHRMKVCKGCWRVWYCGMTCQARDWQDHRDYCLRHRERT